MKQSLINATITDKGYKIFREKYYSNGWHIAYYTGNSWAKYSFTIFKSRELTIEAIKTLCDSNINFITEIDTQNIINQIDMNI